MRWRLPVILFGVLGALGAAARALTARPGYQPVGLERSSGTRQRQRRRDARRRGLRWR